jgi:protein TonB
METLRITALPAVKPPKHATLVVTLLAHALIFWLLLSLSPHIRTIQRSAAVIEVTVGTDSAPAEAKHSQDTRPATLSKPTVLDTQTERDDLASEPRASVSPDSARGVWSGPVATAADVPNATPTPTPVAAPPTVQPASFDADYLDNPAPSYPPLSRRLGEQGGVLLRVLVTRDGSAEQVLLVRSSGYARLDTAAMEAVRRWRFLPARQGDRTIQDWVLVPVNFSLKG